jgi:cytosine/uracil/thiamine/allantoin permease
MDLKNVTSNFLTLIAFLGFGVVVVGSGYKGMEPDPIIAGLGVSIIFADMILWYKQKSFSSNMRKTKSNSKPAKKAN